APNPNYLAAGYLLEGRYRIQRVIGQGGFGITYVADDLKLEQPVCIKELFVSGNCTRGSHQSVQFQQLGDFHFQDFLRRFLQEARQLAKFRHPNIVRVYDIFEANATAYMVMEYIEGLSLQH
ncbi:protein kinase, partial [Arthrospira platensis SPKY1]|nr:protein kinase [Arthrospira platensis SPKY1]